MILHLFKFTAVRYVISGGFATMANLGSLYFFTELLGLWYLFSAVLAFIISFSVTFTLQKFLTFRENNTDAGVVGKQILFLLVAAAIALILNVVFLYIFVDILHVWYLLAQVFVITGLAILNFFVYKKFIFVRA